MQFIYPFCLRRRIEVDHTWLLFLFTCQPTKSSFLSRLGVNVRVHLLRKKYSRNLSSIQSTPMRSGSGALSKRGTNLVVNIIKLTHHIMKLTHIIKLTHNIIKLTHNIIKVMHHIVKFTHHIIKLTHHIIKLMHHIIKVMHHMYDKVDTYIKKIECEYDQEIQR